MNSRCLLLLLLTICMTNFCGADEKSDSPTAELFPLPPRNTEIQWRINLAQAQAEAQSSGKPLLILFTAPSWCGPCRKFEASGASDPTVAKLFNSQTIPVYMDDSRRENYPEEYQQQVREATEKLQVRGVPHFLLTDDQLQPLSCFVGFSTVDDLVKAYETSFATAAQAQSLLDGQRVADINDAALLSQFLATVPDTMVKGYWYPQIDRVLALSQESQPQIHQKWNKWLADLKAQKEKRYLEELRRFPEQERLDGKSIAEIREKLNVESAKADGQPARLRVIALADARLALFESQPERALTLVEPILASPDLEARDREFAFGMKGAALVQLGRIDDALDSATTEVKPAAEATDADRLCESQIRLLDYYNIAERYDGMQEWLQKVAACHSSKHVPKLVYYTRTYNEMIGGVDELLGQLMMESIRQMTHFTPDQMRLGWLHIMIVLQAAGDDAGIKVGEELLDTLPAAPERFTRDPDYVALVKASKDRSAALQFMAKSSSAPVKAQCLLRAALACREQGKLNEAQELIEKADQVLSVPAGEPTARQTALNLRKLCDETAKKESGPG